jgi:cysteine-rich repeat protein
LFACVPDVGVCHDPAPIGCSPCRVDTDCGANAICANGAFGYKAGMNFCMVPCGPADSFGKATCPVAPNGFEMMCFNDNELMYGGPFKQGAKNAPNYLYDHCYPPATVDNTEEYPGLDPPRNVCGNYVREGDEECDDGNDKDTDGCDTKCKVTPDCTFAVKEPNGDVWATPPLEPALDPTPNQVTGSNYDPRMQWVISMNTCRTFKITGAIETPGDVDTVAFQLNDGGNAFLDTYNGGIGKCNADLKTEVRAWGTTEQTKDLNLLDPTVTCEGLSDVTKNLDAATPSLCPSGNLACGSCSTSGLCGSCDDDNGYGDCTRMMFGSTLTVNDYKVDFDGKYKLIRIYAKDPAATISEYMMIVSRFTATSLSGNDTPPGFSCY